MRVCSDPSDPLYNPSIIGVTLNDQPVSDWLIADDFRRCVVFKDGRVKNGSVGFERSEPEPKIEEAPASAQMDSGFSGIFVPAATPAPTAAPAPAPHKHKKRR